MEHLQAGMTGRRPPLGCSKEIQGKGEVEAHMEGRAAEYKVVLDDKLCDTVPIPIACNSQLDIWQSASLVE